MKYRPKIYLAGPVAGLTIQEAMGWRRAVAKELTFAGFEPILPCEEESLAIPDDRLLSPMGEAGLSGCSAAAIFERDVDMLEDADALLVNLAGAKRISIGTVWEIGWACADMKPVVIVMGPEDIHQHCFLAGSGPIVESFAEAVEWLVERYRRGWE